MYKLLAWIIGIAFFAQLLFGSTVTWVYNGEKAKKTFWSGTLKVARGIGQFQRAVLKGGGQ